MGARRRGHGQEVMKRVQLLVQCSVNRADRHGLIHLSGFTVVDSLASLSHDARPAVEEPLSVTPMTALVVDADGRLTYMGSDGRRRVIVGDADLFRRLRSLHDSADEVDGGCGI